MIPRGPILPLCLASWIPKTLPKKAMPKLLWVAGASPGGQPLGIKSLVKMCMLASMGNCQWFWDMALEYSSVIMEIPHLLVWSSACLFREESWVGPFEQLYEVPSAEKGQELRTRISYTAESFPALLLLWVLLFLRGTFITFPLVYLYT